jgi:hypothetical protein
MSNILNVEISPFGYINFTCRKGDSFIKAIEVENEDLTPFDFTGYSVKMDVRNSEGDIIESFTTEDSTIILTEGQILFDKSSIDSDAGEYRHSIQFTKDARNQTVATGDFVIFEDLTP